MDDAIEELVIDVRATTDGFGRDIAAMRTDLDTSLVDGFERAGARLETSLLSALRKGSLGFDDLKRIAMQTLDDIAAQALQAGLGSIFSGTTGGLGGLLQGAVGTLLGLPGRATGGPVSPGQGYLVGERGPELFVPTSAGRVEANPIGQSQQRGVNVAINLATPRGSSAPTALRRSTRQVASAVRRALQEA